MIQVCYYKGCGVVYGEKEPLSNKRRTHGLCPKHLKISLKEIKIKVENRKNKTGSYKVLIIDDNAAFRQLLKLTLQDRFSSIEIYEAADGEEALQKIGSSHPDLVFMDFGLPGENGLELTKRVKSRCPNTIVIILTGYNLPEHRAPFSRYADYVFLKDWSNIENIPTLIEVVSIVLCQQKKWSS